MLVMKLLDIEEHLDSGEVLVSLMSTGVSVSCHSPVWRYKYSTEDRTGHNRQGRLHCIIRSSDPFIMRAVVFAFFCTVLMHLSAADEYDLVWADEFDGNSLNLTNWQYVSSLHLVMH